jgi:hypothetical protein
MTMVDRKLASAAPPIQGNNQLMVIVGGGGGDKRGDDCGGWDEVNVDVGHNRIYTKKLGLDRCLGRTRYPRRNMTNKLGVVRLTTGTWQVGDAGTRE